MSPGTNTSITAITAAPTRPVSWVFAPARSATAVRDPLVLTGKPGEQPGRRRWRRRSRPSPGSRGPPGRSGAANADEVEIVSASETTAMPIAPATRSGRSASVDPRDRERRQAAGQDADERDAPCREVEGDREDHRRDHRHEHARDRRQRAGRARASARG